MAATPFRAINWAPNELIGEDQMNQFANNVQWLYDNTPRATYTLGTLRRTTGVRMASGRATVTGRKAMSATVTVNFGDFFSTGCNPNITTGIVSVNQTKIFETISGIGQMHPDRRGFRITVNVVKPTKTAKKIKTFYVSWHAMGY